MKVRLAVFSVLLSASLAAAEVDFYVSADGDDAWSGTLAAANAGRSDGPFATLERARDAVRKAKKDTPVTVHIRAGLYVRDKTFALVAEDSGTPTAPVTYRNYRNEAVRLVGAREVTGFVPVTEAAVLDRLAPEARSKVLRADLKALGITDFGSVVPDGNRLDVFFQDRPMMLARWPNEGYVKVADVLPNKPLTSHGFEGDAVGKLVYEGDRPRRWQGESDVWLSGYWFWDWADAYQPVESIDVEKRVLSIRPPYHHYGYRKGQRYFALNLLSEIDTPGEWYLDRTAGVLYFWPPAEITSGKVFLSMLSTLISLKDASHVTVRGLTLEMNRGRTVVIEGGSHNRLAGCTLRNVGSQAVILQGGSDHSVVGCDLYDIGDGGVSVEGGDRIRLTAGNHSVVNNHFQRFSRNARTYRPAISLSGVGNRAANNLIHDAPHTAIQFTGNEHVIEFNEIHDVCKETDDAGAIYIGRDWTWRGNVVRYNYFHDMGVYKTWVGVQSVYLDDWTSATTVYGNVLCKAGRGVLVGGGRDNTVENNVFVDCTPAVHIDSRGLGWAKYYFDGRDNTLIERLNAIPYKTPPWSERYPQLLTLYDDEPALAKYNVVARNICVGGRWLDLQDKLTDKIVRVEGNLVNEDPRFVDGEKRDFRLRDDSPAFKLGFKPIPVEKIGLYNDEWRASWPAK